MCLICDRIEMIKRGEMVRFAAEINAQSHEQLKAFDRGYRFDKERSTETEYVFIRK